MALTSVSAIVRGALPLTALTTLIALAALIALIAVPGPGGPVSSDADQDSERDHEGQGLTQHKMMIHPSNPTPTNFLSRPVQCRNCRNPSRDRLPGASMRTPTHMLAPRKVAVAHRPRNPPA
ncbi:hypothetical protein C2E23DRAFT_141049 [Lenzites betulinus]|nr:hypothetical protein C2E23DRAFT_141049 [Lenzites betulinus]